MAREGLVRDLVFYKTYHNNSANVAIHAVFVPGILLATLRLLHEVRAGGVSVADGVAAAYTAYYVRLHAGAGAVAGAVLAGVCWALHAGAVPLSAGQAVALFCAGWGFQFVGHGVFEGRRPALVDNLGGALATAPFFVLWELLFALGLYPALHAQVQAAVDAELARGK
ncbi:AGR171Cp [Eremothecium gossypii ATCC 10895]|uniref:AGR171Cp n=1 Tax=Eremothecium gossypii (strain ATCC 10895 / CBS 109.51 / FGSC 9923 / NRRL Y-1056) TaxID=284811 RepID=Q74ZM7_EREGS|nr:AGR171Cp [Eremothecium gossypii ATCC 10895]AAS54661.2 AGR171Cp [Eremothecium gossypii ATCC 10895]AEY98991.1 FAGR171Cp [Eremothecium gossypii FDAG1]